jgi:large subunit ribosomal protein L17
MLRNMAASLIRTARIDEDDPDAPAVPGRIVTTVAKAKELRPFVEKLVTLAKKAGPYEERAAEFVSDAERNSNDWKAWRESDRWQKWNQAIAPAVACRRRAFALLRDPEAVDILFDELAERFRDRPGGYTRVVQLAQVRLGDGGKQALIEFVGERDREKRKRTAPVVVPSTEPEEPAGEAPPAASTAEETAPEEPAAEDTAPAGEPATTDDSETPKED